MIHFRYNRFLSVTLMHPFYQDSISKDFAFAPTLGTETKLEAFGLAPKVVNGTLVVYQKCDKDDLPEQPVDEVMDLYFVVRPTTDILNITETPVPDPNARARYWFSNLTEDGAYQPDLTKGVALTAEDVLPGVSGQKMVLNLTPGTITRVALKKVVAGSGFTVVQDVPIEPAMAEVKFEVSSPGLYYVDQVKADGTITTRKAILNDALAKESDYWAVLHIQVKPADVFQEYVVVLRPRRLVWQYYLVENLRRPNPIDPTQLRLDYSASVPSQYPSAMPMRRILPADFSEAARRYVAAIHESSPNTIRDVYLFESESALNLLDGKQPQIQIKYNGQALATGINIPRRSMKNTIITYKL